MQLGMAKPSSFSEALVVSAFLPISLVSADPECFSMAVTLESFNTFSATPSSSSGSLVA